MPKSFNELLTLVVYCQMVVADEERLGPILADATHAILFDALSTRHIPLSHDANGGLQLKIQSGVHLEK